MSKRVPKRSFRNKKEESKRLLTTKIGDIGEISLESTKDWSKFLTIFKTTM